MQRVRFFGRLSMQREHVCDDRTCAPSGWRTVNEISAGQTSSQGESITRKLLVAPESRMAQYLIFSLLRLIVLRRSFAKNAHWALFPVYLVVELGMIEVGIRHFCKFSI